MFIFKYDKEGNLYNYIELGRKEEMLCFCSFKNNVLIRYMKDENYKSLTKFKENCKMVHRFEAGESWVSILKINDGTSEIEKNYPFHKDASALIYFKSKEIVFKNREISTFYLNKNLLSKCKEIIEKSLKKQKKYPHIIIKPISRPF